MDKLLKIKKDDISIGLILLKARTFIALIVLVIFFSIFAKNFLSVNSALMVIKHVSFYAILGIGMTAVIISGGIDLSVGSIAGLCGMVAGGLICKGLVLEPLGITIYFNVFIVIIIVLICGTFVGGVNGFIVSRFKVAPFIVTLGTMYIARGIGNIMSGSQTYPNLDGNTELGNTGFPILGSGTFLGIYYSILIMISIALIAVYIFNKTPLGWRDMLLTEKVNPKLYI